MELEGSELSFETGPDGKPRKVEGKAHLPMMAVVAEMMIFANAAVAHRIAGAFPGAALLRRHAPPRPDGFDQVILLFALLRLPDFAFCFECQPLCLLFVSIAWLPSFVPSFCSVTSGLTSWQPSGPPLQKAILYQFLILSLHTLLYCLC